MARRALLIGAETDGLTGVGNDVAAMTRALDLWEFTSFPCEAENASRAGILDAYERLIAQTRPGDAVVVYYSGHGGYSRNPAGGTGQRPFQFIVPTDFHSSADGDFRGITAVELSLLLARLTEKTKNATVVLDCCHSAHMSRDPDWTVKATERKVSHAMIAAHLDDLRRRGQRLDLWTPPGNPNAVRVVACAPEQVAFEYYNSQGVRTGMLTDALTQALTQARAVEVSWATVIDRVRQRVLGIASSQRPEAEGPAHRLLFDVVDTDPVATLPAVVVADQIRISGAALLGVRPGDEFVIMPGDVPGPDSRRKIGDVRVDRVDAEAAWGRLRPPARAVPVDARAHLISTVAPTLPVRVTGPRPADLTRAIDAAPLVRLSEDSPVEVVIDETGGATVRDEIGPLHTPRPTDTDGVAAVLRDLTRLAKARTLRCLAEETGQALRTPTTVEFGQVVDGRPSPLPTSGAVLHVAQPIYVRVRNEGEEPVYVSLLDIGVAAGITVLNPSSPGGTLLTKGDVLVFGGNDLTGTLPGIPLSWPSTLPRNQPRPETIVVLTTSAPVDTRVLEQHGVRSEGPRSQLQRYLDQVDSGGRRDLSADLGPAVRFAVRTIDFDLLPTPAPAPETATFQVDDRPDLATRLWSPPAPPVDVTLRLTDIVVHHNRTFRASNLRIDTLAVTAGAHHAHTERLTAVADGQHLVADVVVYRGTVTAPVDVAVWVSEGRGKGLADLLAERPPDSTEVADVVNVADHLLRRTAGTTTALHRTTLLPGDRLAADPMTACAQDFSLTYSLAATEPSVSRR